MKSKGTYDITLLCNETAAAATATLQFQSLRLTADLPKGTMRHEWKNVSLPQGPGRLQPTIVAGNKPAMVLYLEVKKNNAR